MKTSAESIVLLLELHDGCVCHTFDSALLEILKQLSEQFGKHQLRFEHFLRTNKIETWIWTYSRYRYEPTAENIHFLLAVDFRMRVDIESGAVAL